MKASRFPIYSRKTKAESNEVESSKLFSQAGLIVKHGAGLYTYGPFAIKVLEKLRKIIREELNAAECIEISMPFVQPATLWEESGRLSQMGPEMARFQDRKEALYTLGPTNEEVVTDVFRKCVTTYRQLPTCLYQIGLKFRDEIRPRFGLLRAREFVMMDAYSFHLTQESLDEFYGKIFRTYESIFSRCGLRFAPVEASVGTMGGHLSHEFQVLAEAGEDEIFTCLSCGFVSNAEIWGKDQSLLDERDQIKCPKCGTKEYRSVRGIEVGHIFQLGQKYTEAMNSGIRTSNGQNVYPLMGCYGIGVSRMLAAAVEQNYDNSGIIWPVSIAPFELYLIDMCTSEENRRKVAEVYRQFLAEDVDVFWDDRDIRFGQKMKDWELYGIPLAIIAGKTFESDGKLEVVFRKGGERELVDSTDRDSMVSTVRKLLERA